MLRKEQYQKNDENQSYLAKTETQQLLVKYNQIRKFESVIYQYFLTNKFQDSTNFSDVEKVLGVQMITSQESFFRLLK